MTNHFHSALNKLTTEEVSALLAPLIAVAAASNVDGADIAAGEEFTERYLAGVAASGHELQWITPDGQTFATDAEHVEVSGFIKIRPQMEAQALAGVLTGGRMGVPQPDQMIRSELVQSLYEIPARN